MYYYSSQTARYLMAFDFDHTLIDKNSDLHIVKLAPNGQLPQSIKDTYSPDGWNDFMRTVTQRSFVLSPMRFYYILYNILNLFKIYNKTLTNK